MCFKLIQSSVKLAVFFVIIICCSGMLLTEIPESHNFVVSSHDPYGSHLLVLQLILWVNQ